VPAVLSDPTTARDCESEDSNRGAERTAWDVASLVNSWEDRCSVGDGWVENSCFFSGRLVEILHKTKGFCSGKSVGCGSLWAWGPTLESTLT
jgi:hypothetical protein